jgi:hypothetical protein
MMQSLQRLTIQQRAQACRVINSYLRPNVAFTRSKVVLSESKGTCHTPTTEAQEKSSPSYLGGKDADYKEGEYESPGTHP